MFASVTVKSVKFLKKSVVTAPSAVNEFKVTSVTDTPVVDMKIFVLLLTCVKNDGVSDVSFIGDVDGAEDGTKLGVSLGVPLVVLRGAIKNISRKTIKEKHEAKVKEAAAKKGKK